MARLQTYLIVNVMAQQYRLHIAFPMHKVEVPGTRMWLCAKYPRMKEGLVVNR